MLAESPLRYSEKEMNRSNEPIHIPVCSLSRLSIFNNIGHMLTVNYIKVCLETIRERLSCSNIYLGIKLILSLVLCLMA